MLTIDTMGKGKLPTSPFSLVKRWSGLAGHPLGASDVAEQRLLCLHGAN